MEPERLKAVAEDQIRKMLRTAGPDSLRSRTMIVAMAILYENPKGFAPFEEHMLTDMTFCTRPRAGLIPPDLSATCQKLVAAQELTHGEEITDDAGLDTSGVTERLVRMLAELLLEDAPAEVTLADVEKLAKHWPDRAFSGHSNVLGKTFFAVIAV